MCVEFTIAISLHFNANEEQYVPFDVHEHQFRLEGKFIARGNLFDILRLTNY